MRSHLVFISLLRKSQTACAAVLFAALFILAIAPRANAQTAAPPTSAAPTTDASAKAALDDVLAKRKELATKLDELNKRNAEQPAGAEAGVVSATEDEIEFLEALDGVYAQQQVRFEQRQELLAETAQAAAALDSFHRFGPTEAKPYSFLLLEDLRDELSAEEDHGDALDTDLKPAKQMLEAAQAHFAQAEKSRRRAQEQVAENKEKERTESLAVALKLAQRESQIQEALIQVRRLEVEVRSQRIDLCTGRKTLLSERIDRIDQDVRFAKHDLEDRLKQLTANDAELNGKLKDIRSRAKTAETRQSDELQELRGLRTPQTIIDLAQASWRVARDVFQTEESLLNERIGDNKRWRHYWECRFQVENGTAKPEEIAEWHASLKDLVNDMSANRHSLEQRIESTRVEQAKVVQRMRDSEDPLVKKWGDLQCSHWQRLRDVCESHLVQLKVSQRWSERFLQELQTKLDPQGKESWHSVAASKFSAIWACELVSVNDEPITIGKVFTLVLYLLLSVIVAKLLSRVLGKRILPRFGLNEGASHAVQSIAFYVLGTLLGVMAFELVHVPLSAFTFLGGAVAIAVGFGSQDIANNFMSGIILLAEQPIRVGDIIVVDGVQGTVEHIGPRSTRIKTDANHEMIVPNSKILSDKLTNLTLSDALVQTTVAVTLPNKMPVAQAKVILLQAAISHPTVLHKPEPVVLFKQFGSSTMDFELHFWLQLDDEMRAAIAQSEVREAINDLFQQCDAQPTISAAPLESTGASTPTRRSNAA